MVEGLDLFMQRFRGYHNEYVLIGGAACDVWLSRDTLPFRATKDLDLVLELHSGDSGFLRAFWDFVREGGYSQIERVHTRQGVQKEELHRFLKPTSSNFPKIIELFSNIPASVVFTGTGHLTPIPARLGNEAASLSAIVLDESYFQFAMQGRVLVDGLSLLKVSHLIVLKDRAFLDLRQQADQPWVKSDEIRKHRNDVLRLCQLLVEGDTILLPSAIYQDMRQFQDQLQAMAPEQLDNLLAALRIAGMGSSSSRSVLSVLNRSYTLQA